MFIDECIGAFRDAPPKVALESRADSAFFNEQPVGVRDRWGTEFSMSMPFERFIELKQTIQSPTRRHRADGDNEFFEMNWKPDCWAREQVRLIAIRREQPRQRKGPLQLDLFIPIDFEFQYSVIATNKTSIGASEIAFHHGRGSQEDVIGELKSATQFGDIPCRRCLANDTYMLAATFAHNLLRRLQMQQAPVRSSREWSRPACWIIEKAERFRLTVLHRAGKRTAPKNRPTLTISGDRDAEARFTNFLEQFRPAA